MPRKKQVNINSPIEEPMEPIQPTPPERIMPQSFELRSEQPRRGGFHVSGFLMLLAATAVAATAVYYWPQYGYRDFMNAENSATPFTPKTNDNKEIVNNGPKTYSSATYGFEFQYPADYKIMGDFDADKSISLFEGDAVAHGLGLEFKFIAKPIVQVRGDIATAYEGKIATAKDVKFNGYDSREIVYASDVGGPYKVILISRPGGTFSITEPANGPFASILSTFKFTDGIGSTAYTNAQYGFQLNIPNNLVYVNDKVRSTTGVYFRKSDWQKQEMGKIPQFIFYFDTNLRSQVTTNSIKNSTGASSVEISNQKVRLGQTEFIKATAIFNGANYGLQTSYTMFIYPQSSGSLVFEYHYAGDIPVDKILSTFKFTN